MVPSWPFMCLYNENLPPPPLPSSCLLFHLARPCGSFLCPESMTAKDTNRKPCSAPHLLLHVDGSSENGKIPLFQTLLKDTLSHTSLYLSLPIFNMFASFLRQFLRPGFLRAQPIRPISSYPLQTLARPTPAISTLTFHRTLRTSATRNRKMPRCCRACKCDGDCTEDTFSTPWLTATITFFFGQLLGSGSLQNFLGEMIL